MTDAGPPRKLPLGKRLRQRGLITETQLEVALKEQQRTEEPLGAILQTLGFIREEDLARLLFEDIGVEFVSLRERLPLVALLDRFDVELMRELMFVPLAEHNAVLDVAMANPSDIYAADRIQHETRMTIVVFGATRGEIIDVIARENHRRNKDILQHEDQSDEAAVEAVESMMRRAVELGATDLHIEPEEKLVRVRYRLDGVLTPGENLPCHLTRPVVTRLKLLASLDITESRLPQDGRIRWGGPYGDVDLRVSILPCVQGETVVIRLLDHSGTVPELHQLGVPAELAATLKKAAQSPHGLLYVTGPTGSGKTTTLYSLLATIDPMSRKICTVEDPVEYRLPLIRQCQVQPDIGLDFAAALRSLLRQDPDVILIGETRDQETASIAVRSALTGHFVLSTLHTTSALGAVSRLRDMGVAPFLVSASLSGVIGQRLVRRLCPECREPRPLQREEVKFYADLEIPAPESTWHPSSTNCEACGGRGFRRRVGIYEYLSISDGIRSAIAEGAQASDIAAAAAADGFRPMLSHALELAQEGITSLAEVLRVVPEISATNQTSEVMVVEPMDSATTSDSEAWS